MLLATGVGPGLFAHQGGCGDRPAGPVRTRERSDRVEVNRLEADLECWRIRLQTVVADYRTENFRVGNYRGVHDLVLPPLTELCLGSSVYSWDQDWLTARESLERLRMPISSRSAHRPKLPVMSATSTGHGVPEKRWFLETLRNRTLQHQLTTPGTIVRFLFARTARQNC